MEKEVWKKLGRVGFQVCNLQGDQMKLEVGKKYKNRDGYIVKIVAKDEGSLGCLYYYTDNNGITYHEDGDFVQYKESKEDLIEEIKEEVMFKNGDKVRCIATNEQVKAYTCGEWTTGKIYTVLKTAGDGVEVIADNGKRIGWVARFFELVQPDELDNLIALANAGFDALRTLYKDYSREFVYYNSLGKLHHEAGHIHAPKMKVEKIELPKFESFNVGSSWKVELRGKILKVGCKEFPAKELRSSLNALCRTAATSCIRNEYTLSASRRGVEYSLDFITWEDAEKILTALEKAGL